MKLDTKKFEKEIKDRVGTKRYDHMLRVSKEARSLAKIYKQDEDKAEIAGYFHDCAKLKDKSEIPTLCQKMGFEITDEMKKAPSIIHSFLGAVLAEKLYDIHDEDILNAISWHTTGRPNMSTLEKIVFLADYIEPGRDYPEAKKARTLAYKNLDKAMEYALNQNILNLIDGKKYIAMESVNARNFYLEINRWKLFLNLFL